MTRVGRRHVGDLTSGEGQRGKENAELRHRLPSPTPLPVVLNGYSDRCGVVMVTSETDGGQPRLASTIPRTKPIRSHAELSRTELLVRE